MKWDCYIGVIHKDEKMPTDLAENESAKSQAWLSKRLPQWVLPSGQRKRTKFLSSHCSHMNNSILEDVESSDGLTVTVWVGINFHWKASTYFNRYFLGTPFICVHIQHHLDSTKWKPTSHSCSSMCSIWSHLSQQYTQRSQLSLRRRTRCLLFPSAKMPWRCCFETRYRGHEPANHRSWLRSRGCFFGVGGRPGQSIRIATTKIQHAKYPNIYPRDPKTNT